MNTWYVLPLTCYLPQFLSSMSHSFHVEFFSSFIPKCLIFVVVVVVVAVVNGIVLLSLSEFTVDI